MVFKIKKGRKNKEMVYVTYGKYGRVYRHPTLEIAEKVARKQAKKGENAWVDKLEGKITRNISFFPTEKKKEWFK